MRIIRELALCLLAGAALTFAFTYPHDAPAPASTPDPDITIATCADYPQAMMDQPEYIHHDICVNDDGVIVSAH